MMIFLEILRHPCAVFRHHETVKDIVESQDLPLIYLPALEIRV